MYKILTGKYDADVTPKVTRVYLNLNLNLKSQTDIAIC